jgi:hypothetical protein
VAGRGRDLVMERRIFGNELDNALKDSLAEAGARLSETVLSHSGARVAVEPCGVRKVQAGSVDVRPRRAGAQAHSSWESSRGGAGAMGGARVGEGETVQNLTNRFRRLDRGQHAERTAALGTFQNVDGEHAGHQLRPGIVPGPWDGDGPVPRTRGSGSVTAGVAGIVARRRRDRHNLRPPRRPRGQDPVIPHPMKPGRGH